MTYQDIACRREGAVATIVLHRPEKLNALTFRMLAEMNHAVDRLADEAELRALVLTGTGRAFCAGDDLLAMGGSDPPNDIRGGHHRLVKRIRAIRLPVVAVLNGFALGAGSTSRSRAISGSQPRRRSSATSA
jgi:enoyl-CoA hydratase/carnithine racemase